MGARQKMHEHNMSLGIVQSAPTQFDEPLYRYMAEEARLSFVVYYYGDDGSTTRVDPEIGRQVGWSTNSNRGYPAVFCAGVGPYEFGRRVVQAGHDLVVISGYNKRHALCTALVAKAAGIRVGLRGDNVLPKHGGRDNYWLAKRLLFPIVFRLYTTAHPVGRQAGEYLVKFGFKKESIFRFPYAVDHDWFARECSAGRADVAKLRTMWGLPPAGRVVCGVMKFSEREDPLTLVRAFKNVRERDSEVALLLVGDGPLRRRVEEAAGDQLGKTIVLPGYRNYSELPSVYAASDLFVHTARGAWEVSVNEALACGLPVITSDAVGSAQELIIPNRLGYTFKYGDVGDLAKRIVSVLSDSQLLARARESGLKSLEDWGYSSTAKRLISATIFAAKSS
jgi:glycosyltransferase involved in cell wall biosynthesis